MWAWSAVAVNEFSDSMSAEALCSLVAEADRLNDDMRLAAGLIVFFKDELNNVDDFGEDPKDELSLAVDPKVTKADMGDDMAYPTFMTAPVSLLRT